MASLDAGAPGTSNFLERAAVLCTLAVSAMALGVAPMAVDATYSWTANTVSESAAQGVEGAWVGRLGLSLLGAAVLLQTWRAAQWHVSARVFLAGFGVFMIAAAVFSARSWLPDAHYDSTEDVLHSVAATAMGFCFAFGVVALARTREQGQTIRLTFDVAAIAGSVAIPLAMMTVEDQAGLLQRVMFAISYVWFAGEALALRAKKRDVRVDAPF